jgi:hypothetical protein
MPMTGELAPLEERVLGADVKGKGSEEEVLLEPPTIFKILARGKNRNVLTITLEWIDSPLKYLSYN